ncbi:hypothetical protein RN001_008718 [Aquatica leii]|uniref:Major facilitator superfamily (MFS) profile domain-containing protein n=1 Tax=Aquatica leii TaxID=1421715 RepID=A0AAN7P9Z8_9COLE|nr:hypothetical protein RN001_008718 [Aquatica leii]
MAEPASDLRVITSQVIAALIKNLLLIIIGMGSAYPTILIPALIVDSNFMINKEETSWIGSVNLVTVLVGACLSGAFTQRLGRKRFMQILTIPLFTCWIIFRFATYIWQIFISLTLYGLTQGLIEASIMSYVAEVTQPRVRGMLVATNALSIILGVLIEFGLGTLLSWRDAAAVSSILPLVAFVVLFFIPESPHWLVMRHKLSKARKSLAWLRGWTTVEMVENEFSEMCRNHKVNYDNVYQSSDAICFKTNLKNANKFLKKNFCWPFSIVSLTCFLAVFTGTWTLQTYAVAIFDTFDVPMNHYRATLTLGVVQFLGCVFYVILLRYYGKRMLSFVSLCSSAAITLALGIYAYKENATYLVFRDKNDSTTDLQSMNWIPLVLILCLAFIGQCGTRGLPWTLIGEVFSHETRATGCGLVSAVFYGFAFAANKSFLKMTDSLTVPVVFWINCGINLFGFIILYYVLPETEGRSLQEIIDHFSGISKLDNKVKRTVNLRMVQKFTGHTVGLICFNTLSLLAGGNNDNRTRHKLRQDKMRVTGCFLYQVQLKLDVSNINQQ